MVAAAGGEGASPKGDKVRAKISKMPAPFAEMGLRLHAAILQSAPQLEPVWRWGLPFYRMDGKDLCFFRPEAEKYIVFGFSGEAKLARDPGAQDQLIPSAWFFASLDEATEARLAEMVRGAV